MKRKTNRILSLLLALIMCVSVLTACGGGGGNEAEEALFAWNGYSQLRPAK